MIHFDTNFLIQATVSGSTAHAQFAAWAAAQETFNVSSITWAEFLCGPMDATGAALAQHKVKGSLLTIAIRRAGKEFAMPRQQALTKPHATRQPPRPELVSKVRSAFGSLIQRRFGPFEFAQFFPHNTFSPLRGGFLLLGPLLARAHSGVRLF